MSVSAITQVTQDGQPLDLSSFIRLGVMYVLWTTKTGDSGLRIQWKPHDGIDFSEVIAPISHQFGNPSAIIDPTTDHLIVVWDTYNPSDLINNGQMWSARFNPTTGALISGPTFMQPASKGSLSYRDAASSGNIVLVSTAHKTGSVYIQYTDDGGQTWSSPEPALNTKVAKTQHIVAVPFDNGHMSIIQLGGETRPIKEIKSLTRTRPMVSLVKHPTLANNFFLAESNQSVGDTIGITEHIRGSLQISKDATKLYHTESGQIGTSDGLGSVLHVDATPSTIMITSSAGPFGGANGDNFSVYTVAPTLTTSVDLAQPGDIASFGLSAGFAYTASYSDTSTTAGAINVIRLVDNVSASVVSGLEAAYAVGTDTFPGSLPVSYIATKESGSFKLRCYTENNLTPTLQATHQLPDRANSVKVVLTSGTTGTIYVGMSNAMNIYEIRGLNSPILLRSTLLLPTNGEFYQAQIASNGNIVVAAGSAGIVIYNPTGRLLANLVPSSIFVNEWYPSRTYAINDIVVPTIGNPFAPQKIYFKATAISSGVAGGYEPQWSSSGIVLDGGVTWTPQGVVTPVVTGLEIDNSIKTIYAIGILGGNLGMSSRFWVISAVGLL